MVWIIIFLGTLFTQNSLNFHSHWQRSSPNIIILIYERFSMVHIFQLQRLLVLVRNIPGVHFSCFSDAIVILFVFNNQEEHRKILALFTSCKYFHLKVNAFTAELKTWNDQLLYIYWVCLWIFLYYSRKSYWILYLMHFLVLK